MTLDLMNTSVRLMPANSITEVAAASLSPRAVLSARWREQLDWLTDLTIRLHDISDRPTVGSDATRTATKVELQASIEATRAAMRTTEAALDRITQRTYGSCEDCGATIDPLRLIGFPDATICRRCDRSTRKTALSV